MRIADLLIYPVKGGRALPLADVAVERQGFADDRRWMLVDPAGRAVTQREVPALARLVALPDGEGGLRLGIDDASLDVPRPQDGATRMPVTIWRDTLLLPVAAEAGPFLQRAFGRPLHLIHQPDHAERPVDRDWAEAGDIVSLADGFPILVTTTESLAALGIPFGMDRFRPNLVIEGTAPWAEDGWRRLRIGDVLLDLPKPCARCVVTTVDQEKGVVTGPEPLDTLRATRLSADRRNPGVLFGWNAVASRTGRLRVGDPVEVVAEGEPWPVRPARARAPAV